MKIPLLKNDDFRTGVMRVVRAPEPEPKPRKAWQRERSSDATLTAKTAVRVVYAAYRIVLCIELSPSLLMLNSPERTRPAADLLYRAVDMALRAALQPVLQNSVLANGFRDAPAGFPIVHLTGAEYHH